MEKVPKSNAEGKARTSCLHQFCCTGVGQLQEPPILKNVVKRFLSASVRLVLAVEIIFAIPTQAWALQSHGSPEGLYVHQMSHVLFVAALIYLFWDIRRSSFHGKGWSYLKLFCIVMLLWNLVAFSGHFTHLPMETSDFLTNDNYFQTYILKPLTPLKWIYFLTRLDHLFSVPALFFLYLALRAFYNTTIQDNKEVE